MLIYGWTHFIDTKSALSVTLPIYDITAILAAVIAVCSGIFIFWAPKKFIVTLSASIYGLLILTTGMLVVQSGGVNSPFIALWMTVSVFAGLYGIYGLGIVTALVNIYIIFNFFGGDMTRESIVITFIAGNLPMFISYILWNGRESLEEARNYDVSDLNKTLEKESSKSDAVIEAIGDGVIVVSQKGEILLINPAAQQMTGWSSADAVHLNFESVLKLQTEQGEPLESTLNPIARVLNVGQQVREKDICIITKSGKRIYVAFVVSPMGGAGDGAIAVFRDITKERNEERAQAEFISTASHEMRTPVATMEGYLGLALNPNTATIDDKARDFITKAHDSAQHLGKLFQDLLDISKADDGRLKENPAVIDVVDFMRSVIEGLQPKADQKALDIIYVPDGSKSAGHTTVIAPVLYTYVDKEHLREVADNMVDNAIKYTLQGSVTIDVTANDEYIRISIKDSGVGIPAEDIPHLFQKFYRVDNSDTREIGGTGLGLYLCRKLVESMEGRIWVESELKRGSTFYIEIPRIERAKATELLQREASAQSAEDLSKPAVPTLTATLGTVEQAETIPTPPEETQPEPTLAPAPVADPTPATPTAPDTPHPFGAVTYGTSTAAPATPAAPTIAPTPQAPVAPATTAAPRANTPLVSIERNPSRYTSTPRQ